MFEEVDQQKDQNNNRQAGKEEEKEMNNPLSTEKQGTDSSLREEKNKAQNEKSSEESTSRETKTTSQEGVEDIFEGVDTGDSPQKKGSTTSQDADLPASHSSFLSKGMLKFLIFVLISAVVILGGAYWVSEWMISSL